MIKVAVAFALLTTWCSAASAQSYAFGTGAFNLAQGPTAIVAGDFSRDGRIDVADLFGNGVPVRLNLTPS